MEKPGPMKERRKSPRKGLNLPLEYRSKDAPYAHGALVINASESGLLVQSVKSIPVGAKLSIAVLFPKGFELTNFKVLAEIIWKDLHWEEDWEGYQYGLKFLRIQDADYGKLKQLLFCPIEIEEIGRDLR